MLIMIFSQSQNNSLKLKKSENQTELNRTRHLSLKIQRLRRSSQKEFFQLLKNEFQLGMKYEARGGETEEKKGLDLFLQTLRSHNKSSYWRSVTN